MIACTMILGYDINPLSTAIYRTAIHSSIALRYSDVKIFKTITLNHIECHLQTLPALIIVITYLLIYYYIKKMIN